MAAHSSSSSATSSKSSGRGIVRPVESDRYWNPEFANANTLSQWPVDDARQAQGLFPELIRRLLQETPGATEISIRTGDGVAYPGPDGVARLQKSTSLLPAGRYLFEFGTSSDITKKASSDYTARVKSASPDMNFVFVSVRRWSDKYNWVTERRKQGDVGNVFALDADDLSQWLLETPLAHVWISELRGLQPRYVRILDSWWHDMR